MASMARRVATCVAVGGLALVLTAAAAADDKEKKYTISQIMKKGHGAKGLLKGIDAHVKGGMWDEAKTDATLLKAFGEGLGKNSPERGDAESWKKLTGDYKENTKAVYDAAEKKEAKGVTDGLKKIRGSCKTCHDSHK
jgi:cytochrome c556